MGTKNIRIDDEAYDRLDSRRKEGESFSEAIKRIVGERSLLEIAGIASDEEAEKMREAIAESRGRSRERLDRITEELGEEPS